MEQYIDNKLIVDKNKEGVTDYSVQAEWDAGADDDHSKDAAREESLSEPSDEDLAEIEAEIEAETDDAKAVTNYSTDLVGVYLTEIGRYPILSSEEMMALFERYSNGDMEAKREIVNHNLKLVVPIARHYSHRGMELLDVIQEGNLGLIKAVERYDRHKGFAFSTYATWWIRQACQRSVNNLGRAIRIPIHVKEDSNRLLTIARAYEARTGQSPNIEDYMKETGWNKDRVSRALESLEAIESLDKYAFSGSEGDNDTTIADFISENGIDRRIKSPEEEAENIALENAMTNVLDDLDERQRDVIILRYGLYGNESHTLEQVGEMYGLSRERIRQIEAAAMRRLRHPARIRKLADFIA